MPGRRNIVVVVRPEIRLFIQTAPITRIGKCDERRHVIPYTPSNVSIHISDVYTAGMTQLHGHIAWRGNVGATLDKAMPAVFRKQTDSAGLADILQRVDVALQRVRIGGMNVYSIAGFDWALVIILMAGTPENTVGYSNQAFLRGMAFRNLIFIT